MDPERTLGENTQSAELQTLIKDLSRTFRVAEQSATSSIDRHHAWLAGRRRLPLVIHAQEKLSGMLMCV